MKIGIITLPLNFNYGGCLQAYALQHTLNLMGHEAYILSIQDNSIKSHIKSFLRSLTSTGKFQHKNVRTLVLQEWSLQECQEKQLDAIIVGSDQVWRKVYTNDHYFLGFLGNDKNIIRLAYAASFSVNYIEFEEYIRNRYRNFLQKFKAISVREDTGLELLEKYFCYTSAVHVLDPTMLLEVSVYKKMLKNKEKNTNYIYTYLLNNKTFTRNIIQYIENSQKCPIKKTQLTRNKIQMFSNTIITGIEDWLTNISMAKFMITDSFHGCVFSIIFNTDFVVLENKAGGNTRIESLLRLFNLPNRIIRTTDDYEKAPKIDWNNVNSQLKTLQDKSIDFLRTNLPQ